MRRLAILLLLAAAPIAALRAADPAAAPADGVLRFSWNAMGTRATLLVRGPEAAARGPSLAAAASNAAERVEAVASVFRPTSDTARLNAAAGSGEWIETDPEFRSLFFGARTAFRLSGGAFNPLVAPFFEHHGFSRRPADAAPACPERPSTDLLDLNAVESKGTSSFRLARPGMALDFGGIAKGQAVGAAVWEMRRLPGGAAEGVEWLFNFGGTMQGFGDWTIGLRDPRGQAKGGTFPTLGAFTLSNGWCVATSGGYERFVEKPDGTRVPHIVDPRTGDPVVGDVLQVSVLVPPQRRGECGGPFRAALADALSTALFVLGKEEGEKILPDGCRAVWVLSEP